MRLLLAIVLVLAAVPAQAVERSSAEKRAFQREHACPSTGMRRGRCPGFVIDHSAPLCAGGADRRENMQWQQIAAAKRKDVEERRLCRALQRSAL
jgi:hypothetical protein